MLSYKYFILKTVLKGDLTIALLKWSNAQHTHSHLDICNALNIFLEKEFNWLHKKSKTENDGKDSIEPFNL